MILKVFSKNTQLYDVRNHIVQRKPGDNVKYLLRVALKHEMIVKLSWGRKKKLGCATKIGLGFNSLMTEVSIIYWFLCDSDLRHERIKCKFKASPS